MNRSAASELLLRNPAEWSAERIVVVDPADCGILTQITASGVCQSLEVVSTDYGAWRVAHRHLGTDDRIRVHFGTPDQCQPGSADLAIVYAGKGRATHQMLLALTTGVLQAEGRLLWLGETRAGVRASAKFLGDLFERVDQVDAARRCALYSAEIRRSDAPPVGALDDWLQVDALATPQGMVAAASLPGVFSQGRLDDGTRLLLDSLPDAPPRRVLDFGCGCGVIGVCGQRVWPSAEIDLVDASALALTAAHRTLQLHDMAPERVFASDVFSDVRERYDLILTNPPFHAGIAIDYSVVRSFIADARDRLQPRGRLRMVVNRHLPYRDWLAETFGKCTIAVETPRFRVWDAVAPAGRS